MKPRSLALTLALATLAAALTPVSATAPAAGGYVCVNLGGNPIPGRRFNIGDDGSYRRSRTAAGSISVQGRKVFFRGGALDGHQALQLPDGRLRLSRTSFCEMVETPPVAQPVPPQPAPALPTEPPPAKLIKVKPGAH